MEGGTRIWGFLLICLIAVVAGTGMGILLGGANSDPFETVVKTVPGERHTVTETETETVTKTTTETVTESEAITEPVAVSAGTDDDTNQDDCSDSYAPVCLEPYDGTNHLSCLDIADQDFTSTKNDPYRLDGDGDEVACESK
ncbi:MAG: hypothetical protein ACRDN8_15330 [Thermoleophilaceae bacterium]